MKYMKILLLSLIVLSLGACTMRYTKLYNIDNQSTMRCQNAANKDRVRTAILTAGDERGWSMKSTGPGVITGTIHLRAHVAVITIPYNNRSYSIKYKSSKNLTRDGYIHKNYISWIKLLNQAIQAELTAHCHR